MSHHASSDEPRRLERLVVDTRHAMRDTLHQLKEELSPRHFAKTVLTRQNAMMYGRQAAGQVSRRPLPFILTGLGVVLLALIARRFEARKKHAVSARNIVAQTLYAYSRRRF